MLPQFNLTLADLPTIGFLAFLEGILSIDNAVVLALLARPLPKKLQKKALTYGLVGAVVFRLIALSFATKLMEWHWVKFVGAAYLLFLAIKHFVSGGQKEGGHEEDRKISSRNFWMTVVMIELTDIAFAVDSILAAIALSTKFWVVFAGGVMGIIMMRFAASVFLKLLKRFPRFEDSAYLLVAWIGAKLLAEGFEIPGVDFHSSSSPAFWVFWLGMAAGVATGFIPKHFKLRRRH